MISAKDARALVENENERTRQRIERIFGPAIEVAAQMGKTKIDLAQMGCTWHWIEQVVFVLEDYGYKTNIIKHDNHHYCVEVEW